MNDFAAKNIKIKEITNVEGPSKNGKKKGKIIEAPKNEKAIKKEEPPKLKIL